MADLGVTLIDHSGIYIDALDKVAKKVLTEWGMQAETAAKDLAPVDTGNLKNSISYAVREQERSVYIGSNVEYAPYQELGTSKMSAANQGRGFLRPAIEDNVAYFRNILETELKNA